MAGATLVVGIDVGDLDGDGLGDVVERARLRERARRGARLDSGPVDELLERGDDGLADDMLAIVTSRGGEPSGADGEPGEDNRFVTNVAVDAPVLHLVNAGGASNEVKFKAGAELSGQVT